MNDISDKCLICHWYCDEVLEECQGEDEPCHEFKLARLYTMYAKKCGGKMERLTDDNFRLGFDDGNKLPSYESVYERLREYEKLEEDGKMIKLPCKLGETVYVLRQSWNGWNIDKRKFSYSMIGKFGKTVFLAEPQAKERIKELENESKC